MLSASLDGENWVSWEYLYILTYILDSEISPQNNIVRLISWDGLIDGEKLKFSI